MSDVDLSQLPAPDIVAPLDYEGEVSRLQALVLAALPELADVLALESEPINKVLQILAYEHVTMQARINDAARACMLAYATGADLDSLAANLGVARLSGEDDARLRRRAQMAIEGATVAGSAASYLFHALGAHPDVRDAGVDSPQPGVVRVTLLSTQGDGTASPTLLAAVRQALSADDVRPLTDTVTTDAAQVVPYTVHADLITYHGPAAPAARAAALAAVQAYTLGAARLGYDITRSALFACLHQAGVQNVVLHSPAQDIVITPSQAPWCTSVQVEVTGQDV